MNQSYRPFWGDLKKLVCIGFTGLPHHVGGRLIVVSFCFFVLLMFEKGTNMKEKTEDLLNKAWVSHVSTIEVVHVSMFPKQERSIYDPPIRMAFCGRLTLFFASPLRLPFDGHTEYTVSIFAFFPSRRFWCLPQFSALSHLFQEKKSD